MRLIIKNNLIKCFSLTSILLFIFIICSEAQIKVDILSLITTQIKLLKGDNLVATGTGFYFIKEDTIKKQFVVFLVTNLHVLTGSSPIEKVAPIGDNIIFYLHKTEGNLGLVKEIKLPLYTKNKIPIWLTSKEFQDADIAIIPLPSKIYGGSKPFAISSEWYQSKIVLHPTSAVTLIGYPYGYYDTINSLPIYKTGTIASEPDVDFNKKPLFLIDVSAFPGMSGSPAFAIAYGAYQINDSVSTVGGIRKFLGIYASMEMIKKKNYIEEIGLNKKEGFIFYESMQLGQVWKAKLILQIINEIDIAKYENEILLNL